MRDLDQLASVMQQRGYNLQALCQAHPVAVFGSRAAGCDVYNSDWDVVVFTTPPKSERVYPLDYLQEDPLNDPRWYTRDLAFHLTGYAHWLSGSQMWETSKLDWEGAIERKTKALKRGIDVLGKNTLTRSYQAKWVRLYRAELGRIKQLQARQYITPTRVLPELTIEDFEPLGISQTFREIFQACSLGR